MNKPTQSRATFVLTRETNDQLSYIATRMGISRSRLVRDTITAPIDLMHRWVSSIPINVTPREVDLLFARMSLDLSNFIEDKANEAGNLQ